MSRASFLRVLMVGLAAAILCSACASTRAVPRPFPMPARAGTPPQEGPESASTPGLAAGREPDWHALVGTALDLRGIRYSDGGTDPRGFDCSGFTQYVFARHGVALPRAVREQSQDWPGCSRRSLPWRPVVFHDGRAGRLPRGNFGGGRRVRARAQLDGGGTRRAPERTLLGAALSRRAPRHAALNWPFRTSRLDVSFMNCRM